MTYKIKMGVPEMEQYWHELTEKANNENLNKTEKRVFKNNKALNFLSQNPLLIGYSGSMDQNRKISLLLE